MILIIFIFIFALFYFLYCFLIITTWNLSILYSPGTERWHFLSRATPDSEHTIKNPQLRVL